MKRQYITPSVFCVKLDSKRAFMQNMSVNDVTVNDGEGGWAREDNNNTDEDNNNRNSVWDNIW